MERFRPNLVLEGLPPFAEDRIATLAIGPVDLTLVKPCTRCIIPSTDQRTGIRGLDPLPVLRTFRFDRKLLGVTFGENAVITARRRRIPRARRAMPGDLRELIFARPARYRATRLWTEWVAEDEENGAAAGGQPSSPHKEWRTPSGSHPTCL